MTCGGRRGNRRRKSRIRSGIARSCLLAWRSEGGGDEDGGPGMVVRAAHHRAAVLRFVVKLFAALSAIHTCYGCYASYACQAASEVKHYIYLVYLAWYACFLPFASWRNEELDEGRRSWGAILLYVCGWLYCGWHCPAMIHSLVF